jgi:hypothetical protein
MKESEERTEQGLSKQNDGAGNLTRSLPLYIPLHQELHGPVLRESHGCC